jgi:ABC-type multidrug transport system fused ATPase/permease subunit
MLCFSTVRKADRILVIEQGRVVEEGSHEELLEHAGSYARLFLLQAAGYLDSVSSTPSPRLAI